MCLSPKGGGFDMTIGKGGDNRDSDESWKGGGNEANEIVPAHGVGGGEGEEKGRRRGEEMETFRILLLL